MLSSLVSSTDTRDSFPISEYCELIPFHYIIVIISHYIVIAQEVLCTQ